MGPLVPREYMREDIYLIRWLRGTSFNPQFAKKSLPLIIYRSDCICKAANFNLDTAEEMLIRNFKWRKQKNMDHILEEDFTDIIEEYSPMYVDITDKKGQPGDFILI